MKKHDGTIYWHCENCGAYVVEGEWDAHECDEVPEDVQTAINAPSLIDVDVFDEQVHDLKGNEAAGINNGGMESQIRYLHYEAGMPWSEIREMLSIEEPKP